jgi:hypothetical protein
VFVLLSAENPTTSALVAVGVTAVDVTEFVPETPVCALNVCPVWSGDATTLLTAAASAHRKDCAASNVIVIVAVPALEFGNNHCSVTWLETSVPCVTGPVQLPFSESEIVG